MTEVTSRSTHPPGLSALSEPAITATTDEIRRATTINDKVTGQARPSKRVTGSVVAIDLPRLPWAASRTLRASACSSSIGVVIRSACAVPSRGRAARFTRESRDRRASATPYRRRLWRRPVRPAPYGSSPAGASVYQLGTFGTAQKKLAALHGRSADDLAKAVEETISEVADTQLSDDVTLVVVSRNASRVPA